MIRVEVSYTQVPSSETKVCDTTVHACIFNTTGNIIHHIAVQYNLFNRNNLLDALKINISLHRKGNTFGKMFLAFRNIL